MCADSKHVLSNVIYCWLLVTIKTILSTTCSVTGQY